MGCVKVPGRRLPILAAALLVIACSGPEGQSSTSSSGGNGISGSGGATEGGQPHNGEISGGRGGAGEGGGASTAAGAPPAGSATAGGGSGACGDNCECGPSKACDSGAECVSGACRKPPQKPNGACQYRYHAGHDYYFCDVEVDHAAAAAACSAVGMTLVHVNDQAENVFIDQTITAEACCSTSLAAGYKWAGLWIGATDTEVEGEWRWEDDHANFWQGVASGMAVGGAFTSWDQEQPNNGNLGADENCARTRGSRWNDTPCALDADALFVGMGYICES